MAKFEHKKNTGSLFKKKDTWKDSAPDWKGEINVEGKIYELSLWTKTGNKGEYFSAQIQPPREYSLVDPINTDPVPEPGIVPQDDLPF